MLVLPTAAQIHLARENRRLTICGVIEKGDGTFIRCTQHDEDIDIDTGDLVGTYDAVVAISASDVKSGSDLSVDNMEVTGYMTDSLSFAGFTAADIDAGLFANAPFQTFLCQWDDPSAWQKIIRRGFLGDIKRTAEGQFQVEWRGIMQPLQQSIGRTLSERCDVKRYGDARCKKDVESLVLGAIVTNVTSNRVFRVDVDASPLPDADHFTLGEATWLTGENAGYSRQQIKRDTIVSTQHVIELWEEMPNVVQVGDTLSLRPGCNFTFEACKERDNAINYRGHGRWIPGIPSIIRAP